MNIAPGPVREPAWSLSRSAIGFWVTQGVVQSLVMVAGVAAFLLLVPSTVGGPVPALRWLVPIAVAVEAVLLVGVRPWLRFRVHRWEITNESVYTQTGWLSRTWTLVPISRIQTVDVTRGVLQQVFGLSTVAVLTASFQGTVRIPHLDTDIAHRVADDLAHRTEQVRDHAT
jgi:membrane protein YdbS with pleckstrin-like domain